MRLRLSRAFYRRHPSQLLLALTGIAAGIAVVTGVALLRGALLESLDAVAAELVGDRSLVVRHASGRLPVETYAALATTPGAPDWVPVLRIPVRATGRRLELVGVDLFSAIRAPAGNGTSPLASGLAEALYGPADELPRVAASPATLALLEARVGDRIELERGDEVLAVRVGGAIPARAGLDRRLFMDIAQAQRLTGELGWLSELLAPAGYRDWIRQHAGEELVASSALQQRASARRLTGGMRANLTAMSLLALATGLFVVYSVLNFLVVQRRGTFGLLRALGMTPGSLARMLLAEVWLVAAFGGLTGLVAGTVLSERLLALVAAPLSEVYGQLPPAAIEPDLLLYAGIWLAGLAAATLVTVPVLREALAVPPGRLVREAVRRPRPPGRPAVLAAGLLAAGAAWIVLDPGLTAALGGLFLMLAGLLALIPGAGFGLLAWLSARLPEGLLARAMQLLQGARARLAAALAALALALALAIGMGMMILGFRGAVGDWVAQLLRADLYVSVPGRTMRPDEVGRIEALSGVRAVSSVRRTRLADGTAVTAYRLPPEAWSGFDWIGGAAEAGEAFARFDAGRAVVVSEPFARRRGLAAGDTLRLHAPTGRVGLPVAGVFRDYSSEQGFVAISSVLYRRWFDDRRVDSIGVYLADGVSPDAFVERLQSLGDSAGIEGNFEWITPGSVRSESLAVFDRTFRISWALAALVGLIALVALTSALLAQGLERAREHATLRALGLTPGRLAGLIALQSTGLTAIALAMAIPLSVLIHYALSLVVQPRAFGWSLPVGLPPAEPVLWVVPAALLLGALTGLYPAWRIGRRPVVEHLRARA